MTLNDENKIILYDYGNKDYKAQVATAKSFQDIVNVFEVCFPGMADKYQSFAAFTDKVKVTVATIKDPSTSPEAQYDAIEQWDNYRSGSMVDALKTFDGFDYMGFIEQKEEIRRKLPEKMLDSYIITAQDMTARLNSIKEKEAEYRDLVTEINRKQSEIIEKYEPERQAAEKEWSDMMNNEYNPWQKRMGYGLWQNSQEYQEWAAALTVDPAMEADFNAQYKSELADWNNALNIASRMKRLELQDQYDRWQERMGYGKYTESREFKHGNQFPPGKISEFNDRYRKESEAWQQRMTETRESQTYTKRRNEEFEQQTGDMQKRIAELKQELSDAQVKAYDAVINSILANSPVSEEHAAEWSKNNVIYDKSAMSKSAKNGYGKKEIERDVQLFYRLTGGRLPRLEFATTRKGRSCAAHWSGSLFIGSNFGQRTLWHEMAHLLEDDPKIKAAAIAFRDRRRDDAQLHRLKDLVPGSNYDPKEVAYKDSWLDPYIGKDYGQTATEVISMGMQQLASVPAMFDLHEKDPEHLAFMLGLCASKPVIDAEDAAKKQARTQEKVAKASKVENLQKELDKQVAKAGDFWSADGISVVTEKQWSYKSRKYVERTEIKYNQKFDEQGRLNSYSHYTARNEKVAKRALYVWYKAGKPTGQGSGDFNLWNIIYQFDKTKANNSHLIEYALQQSTQVGA